MARAVHDRPSYLECPDVLFTVGETSYGIRVGFVESDTVFTIIYLFYLFVKPQSLHSRTSNLLFLVTTLGNTSLTLFSFLSASIRIPVPFLSLFCFGWKVRMLGCRSLSAANRLCHSKIYVSNPSYLSPMVPRVEVDSEIYNGQSRTACILASTHFVCCTNNVQLHCALHPGCQRLQTHTH